MKLKKIVSLALAGVMAVSMLAGCSGNTKPVDPEVPVEPAAGISAEVGALLDAPEYVTFENDTKLDSALKTAAEYAGVMDVMPKYVHATKLERVDSSIYEGLGIDTTKSAQKTWMYLKLDTIGAQSELQAVEKAAGTGYEVDDAVVTEVWAISSSIGQTALKNKIADKIQAVEKYNYSVVNDDDVVGGNFNYTYTVSISTYTKTVNSSVAGNAWGFDGAADPAVTFVAVQVVRTATHQ